VILKLGAYGIYRISSFNLIKSSLFIIISIIGGMFIALFCLRQTDLKTLIAYSSVVHIRFIIGGVFNEIYLRKVGILLIIFRHGLRSSCIFFLVNFYYERTGSRNIIINKRISEYFSSMML
jgi:NADH-ubiquinone oxidoreductase chain 4